MMKKPMTLAAAVALCAAVAVPNAAEARGGRIAAGVIGGLAAGAIIGGALASPYYGYGPYYPAYYGPGPYYYGPGCYWRRVLTPFGWRRERICY
jgi:hypothetical protein